MTDTANKTVAERVTALAQLEPRTLAAAAVEANDLLIEERKRSESLRKAYDSTCKDLAWWQKRNGEVHDELSATANTHRDSMREWGKQKADYIREVAALKREVAALKHQLEELQANRAAPFNDEWDSWSDAAQACDAAKYTFDAARDKQVLTPVSLSKVEMLRTLRETLPPDSFVFIEPTFDSIDPPDMPDHS
jgi:hypothetical protein